MSDKDEREHTAELRRREALTERIFEAMPGGIVHVRADGAIERANAEARRVLGLSLDELTGRYYADFEPETIWEDGSPCAAQDYPVARALMTGEPQPPATIGVRRPDGAVSWAVFTALPVTDPESGQITGAVVTFLDITDRKRAEKERRQLEQRLVMADRMASVGTLAAGVAHEINNPLTYVLTNLQLLEAELTAAGLLTDARHRQRLADSNEGLGRIREVVRDLSTFSHDEPELRAVDVHPILESSLRMAANELRYRARIRRDYAQVPAVMAHPSRLGQVFLNLLVNAGHAIDAGSVDDNEVAIRTRAAGDRVVVEIADTGCGIDEGLRARMFEPFVTTKDIGEGTGLGLYICHQIIEALGGSIEVTSAVGRGSRFRLTLPATDAVTRAPVVPATWRRPTAAHGTSMRILVVDDEPAILNLFEGALAGHQVTLATSGRQALHELAERSFDLVFCDLIMPDVTGMDVFERACQRDPSVQDRFIFMTGGAFTERARRFVEALHEPILAKPFGAPELEQLLAGRG